MGAPAPPPRDNYTTIPLQYPTLSPTNYMIWAVNLKAIFSVHGLWEVIAPNDNAAVNEKKNNAVIAYLFQAMPEDLVLQVANLPTAREIWESIKTRYVGVDRVKKVRLATLKNEFEALRMREDESTDEFSAKISVISLKANDLGGPFEEKLLVGKLLNSVPPRFIQIVVSIEQFVDLETMLFQEAIGRLKAFEERTNLKNKQPVVKENELLSTYSQWQSKHKENNAKNQKWVKGSASGNGNQLNQKEKDGDRDKSKNQKSFERKKKDKSKVKCYKCNNLGHYERECSGLNTRDQDANLSQAKDEDPALYMVESDFRIEVVFLNELNVVPAKYEKDPVAKHVWYLDNGALSQPPTPIPREWSRER
ncbi:uncharacterized protein LOC143626065 [Bidens hawaiensis]|uniref:uncharacterized protein LOC143626065 n=1 Tax=Bidens hawaiensis TaxID=980011 RepID=UPI0040494920